MATSIMADWSQLPYDIIHKVAAHLSVIEDFLAFSAVCCSWRSVYLAKQWHPGPQVPVLMFSDNEKSSTRSFLSLYSCKISNSELTDACRKRCWGSSLGLLVTIGNDYNIQLLNPFTRASINLPPMPSQEFRLQDSVYWYNIIEKAFVFRKPSSSNANEDLVVMIIYGATKELAFCRPGYSSWKGIKDAQFVDVTCVEDQIFALTFKGTLVVVDIDSQSLTSISGHSLPRDVTLSLLIGGWERLSLVESSGDLWMVYDNQQDNGWRSGAKITTFMVYTFDFDKTEWIRLSNLGSSAMFVGDDGRIVACVTPHCLNLECNCIYFVASKWEKGSKWENGSKREKRWPNRVTHVDVGVYNLRSGVTGPLCINPHINNCFSFPLWVTPTLL